MLAFGVKAIHNHFRGYSSLFLYAPLIATWTILGKRRRTSARSSKPDIRGMLRSERITSGMAFRSCKRARSHPPPR
jgi:hypothetical protein